MKEQHVHALQSLRDRIRAVCVHDQAQWDATWKEVLGGWSSSRRALIPTGVFFEVLEANSVLLGRTDARLLLWQFQEQNGAVVATRFLRWIALNAPADHMNPDLLVPQLPQPYRRIKKVFDRVIFDAAWEIIMAESARFKAEGSTLEGSSGANHGADKGQIQQRKDYDVAQRRCCEPTWQIPLDSSAQQIVGLASHCLLPLVVAGINSTAPESSATNGPLLRAVSTANEDASVLGDFAIELPADTQTPEGRSNITVTVHVVIKKLSALQLLNARQGGVCCCFAVHLIETTTFELVDPEALPDAQPPAQTVREFVNIYESMQPNETSTTKFSCQLLTMVKPTRGSLEPSFDSIVLSPDSMYLAVTSFSSTIVALYCLRQEVSTQNAEAERQPQLLSAPAFQADLAATRSPFTDDEGELLVHFLVAPTTLRPQRRAQPPAPPNTYAFAVSYGPKLLKFLLPSSGSSSTPPTPILLTPAKSWEHLTKISASTQDITTQYLVVGCEDGTIVVWDVLQDNDYAFLSSFDDADTQTESTQSKSSKISNVVFSPAGYIAALSKTQQRLYFFDVRERGKTALMRMVSLPGMPSSTNTRQPSSHSAVLMTSLGVSTSDIPVVFVEFSSGMVVLYDVRSAEAIGSFWSAVPAASSPATHQATSSTEDSTATSIVGNQEVLGVATNAAPSMEAAETSIKLFSWYDILLACFPFFENVLQQRQEDMTTSTLKQLFLSTDIDSAFAATPPSIITASGGSSDLLESIFMRMAGELPLSPQQAPRTRNSLAGALSPQSSLGQNSMSNTSGTSTPTNQYVKEGIDQGADSPVMLEPIIPNATAFFEEYCRQYLDPVVVADKEAKLHRKRRELLKTMSAGGAW